MKAVTTYLSFDGNARQAMSFYKDCFGADLDVNAYPDETGAPSTDPSARVMHSHLVKGGSWPFLMASDTPMPGSVQVGTNFSVAVECDSPDEEDRLFAALSKDGEVRQPIVDAPWGARFGMLTDKFGVTWLLNYMPQG